MGYGCGVIFGMLMGYLMFKIGKPKWIVRMVMLEQHIMLKRLKKNAQRHSGKKQLFTTICGWFCESFSRSFQRHVVLCCNFWKPLRFHKMVGSLCRMHLLRVILVSRSWGFQSTRRFWLALLLLK